MLAALRGPNFHRSVFAGKAGDGEGCGEGDGEVAGRGEGEGEAHVNAAVLLTFRQVPGRHTTSSPFAQLKVVQLMALQLVGSM